ncbi:MAG: glycosyltransferase, partial [Lachnospiraceae bacterium]|nr:glycosyltransferase [Lachnospiraceae bacterium]
TPLTGIAKLIYHFHAGRRTMLRKSLNRALCGQHFNTIVSFMEGPAMLAHTLIMSKADRNISWVHTNMVQNPWADFCFRSNEEASHLYNKMNEVVFVSDDARIAHLQRYTYTGESKVIYNLIPTEVIRKKSDEPIPYPKKADLLLCTVGRLSPEKAQTRLIDAVADLNCRFKINAEAWIIGDGDLLDTLKNYVREKGVGEKVTFYGFQTNPFPFVKASDIFVLTSKAEGFSLVVAEAMVLGKPVVSTKVSGPIELLAEGGGVLTSHSPKDIARAIADLWTDKAAMQACSARTLQRAAQFNPEATMQQIYHAIDGEKDHD